MGNLSLRAQSRTLGCGEGTTIELRSGTLEPGACAGSAENTVLRFRARPFYMPYVLAVVDQEDNIIFITRRREIDFAELPGDAYRVYGLFYTGLLRAEPGMNINNDELATYCWGFTENFIQVNAFSANGGSITAADGSSRVAICENEAGAATTVSFATTSSDENYLYAITDTNSVVLDTTSLSAYDFAAQAEGEYLVYGLSYEGDLLLSLGDTLAAGDELATSCSGLSQNFLEVSIQNPEGGSIRFSDGTTSAFICEEDPPVFEMQTEGAGSTPYVYVVTGRNHVILRTFTTPEIDLSDLPPSTFRVYGLAYTGELSLEPGADIRSATLSTECFDLSDNNAFITIPNLEVDNFSLLNGELEATICRGGGAPTSLEFTGSEIGLQNKAYLITDADLTILEITRSSAIDFAAYTREELLVWCLGYTGTLLAEVGDRADEVELASQCGRLSPRPVIVRQAFLTRGSVQMFGSGGTEVEICLEEDLDRSLIVDLLGMEGPEVGLILTDNSGLVFDAIQGPFLTVERDRPNAFRVYGIAYSGALTAPFGQNVDTAMLARSCFVLSDNFIQFNTQQVEGGTVSLPGGATEVDICVGDSQSDELVFEAIDAGFTADYRFVLTDASDEIILELTGNSLDFDISAMGESRVYGVSYSGQWTAVPGDNIRQAVLSDGCYDLSDNFIRINGYELSGGQVTLESGLKEEYICEGGAPDLLAFANNGASGPNYAYFVTNTDDQVLGQINAGQAADFDAFPDDTVRVWGVAYIGELNDVIGREAPIFQLELATECYDLSLDYARVIKSLPDAGTLAFDDGSTRKTFCIEESSRMVSFAAQDHTFDAYLFLVTDQNDILRFMSVADVFDFSNLPAGEYRIYGLIYKGALQVQMGQSINAGNLSNDCFDLTDNFLSVMIDEFDAGVISLEDGATELYICGDTPGGAIEVSASDEIAETYRYVLLDENEVVLGIFPGAIPVDALPADSASIRGLAYAGDLLLSVGDTLDPANTLATGCYAVSSAAIPVIQAPVEGGSISLAGSTTDSIVLDCEQPGDTFTLTVSGAGEAGYIFILTDDGGQIRGLQENPQFDLSDQANGRYFIRGAAYNGALSLDLGQTLDGASISTGCADLAEGTVEVQIQRVDAGTLSLPGGQTSASICEDGITNTLTFVQVAEEGESYAYVLTDTDGVIREVRTDSVITVTFGGADSLLVYGLAYNGDLLAEPGMSLVRNLASGCYERTEVPVTLLNETPEAGALSLADGSREVFLCPDDPGLLLFDVPLDGFFLLLTNPDNELIRATSDPGFDLSGEAEGSYRIWGVVTEGTLTLPAGEDVTSSPLSDLCFALTDNYVEVSKQDPMGGQVFTLDGEELVYGCPNQGTPNLVEFETLNTQNSGAIAYILTDTGNQIVSVLPGAILDLDSLSGGDFRLWSLTYQGDLLAAPGQDAAGDPLATACYSLSDNFVSLILEEPLGGQIRTTDNTGDIVCINNIDTEVELIAEGISDQTDYTFLVTNDQKEFLFATDAIIDFDFFFQGNLNIYGLAFTGDLTLEQFDVVTEVSLSDDCFALSDNFLTIVKEDVDGGNVSTTMGETVAYVCPGDGVADLIRFQNSSSSVGANYAYVVTTADNLIFTALTGDQRDFDNVGAFRELRIWGVSYTGTLNIPAFSDLFANQLSDGCFDVSNNFVTIYRQQPEGGEISTSVGSDDLNLCPGAVPDVIKLQTTSSSVAGYAYILRDDKGVVQQVITDGELDLRSLALGTYELSGLSYTGQLLVAVGDTLATVDEFATSCFERSTNTLSLSRGGEVFGGTLSTPSGEEVFYTCPFDGLGDLIFVETPEAIPGTTYRLVISGTDNRILFPDIEGGIIPFDGASEGEYRIWGVSFTGDFRGQFGLNVLTDPLSTDCYTTSDNFITVVSAQPDGGRVRYAGPQGEAGLELSEADTVLSLENQGASAAQYTYLLTDAAGVILQSLPGDELDVATLETGDYRIYGLSFAGQALDAEGQQIDTAQLANNCFDLSENFLDLSILPAPSLAGDLEMMETLRASRRAEQREIDLRLAPNPVRSVMNLSYILPEGQSPLQLLEVFDLTGRRVYRQAFAGASYLDQIEIYAGDWQSGVYVIRLRGMDWSVQRKIVKIE